MTFDRWISPRRHQPEVAPTVCRRTLDGGGEERALIVRRRSLQPGAHTHVQWDTEATRWGIGTDGMTAAVTGSDSFHSQPRHWSRNLPGRTRKNGDPATRVRPREKRDYARDGEGETSGKQTQQKTCAPREEGDQPGDEGKGERERKKKLATCCVGRLGTFVRTQRLCSLSEVRTNQCCDVFPPFLNESFVFDFTTGMGIT